MAKNESFIFATSEDLNSLKIEDMPNTYNIFFPNDKPRYLLEAFRNSLYSFIQLLEQEFNPKQTRTVYDLASQKTHNTAVNMIKAVCNFAEFAHKELGVTNLASKIKKLNDLASLNYPRGFKVAKSESEMTNLIANKLDGILTNFLCYLKMILKLYPCSEIPVGEELYAESVINTLQHLLSLVHQLKTKQKLKLEIPAELESSIEANEIAFLTTAPISPIPIAIEEARTQLSALNITLIQSLKNITDTHQSKSEEKEKIVADNNSLHQQIENKKTLLDQKTKEGIVLRNSPSPEPYTHELKILNEAKITLEKEGKSHITNEIKFQELSDALALNNIDQEKFKADFKKLSDYSKATIRIFKYNKEAIRQIKLALKMQVNNRINAFKMKRELEINSPQYINDIEIKKHENELEKITQKIIILDELHPIALSLAQTKALTMLNEMATQFIQQQLEFLKQIDNLNLLEKQFESGLINAKDYQRQLSQIEDSKIAISSQLCHLLNTTNDFSTTNKSITLEDYLPLEKVRESFYKTANLFDYGQQTAQLKIKVVALNNNAGITLNEEKRANTLSYYKYELEKQKNIRKQLATQYIGDSPALQLQGETGDYLNKRNKKYAGRDFLFSCLPGAQRAKRTAYLSELSELLQNYTNQDDKKNLEAYCVLTAFIQKGIKQFKPRSKTSEESLRFCLQKLLNTINTQYDLYTQMLDNFRCTLPEPAHKKGFRK